MGICSANQLVVVDEQSATGARLFPGCTLVSREDSVHQLNTENSATFGPTSLTRKESERCLLFKQSNGEISLHRVDIDAAAAASLQELSSKHLEAIALRVIEESLSQPEPRLSSGGTEPDSDRELRLFTGGRATSRESVVDVPESIAEPLPKIDSDEDDHGKVRREMERGENELIPDGDWYSIVDLWDVVGEELTASGCSKEAFLERPGVEPLAAMQAAQSVNWRTVLDFMCSFGYLEIISNVREMEDGLELLQKPDSKGNTILHHAVERCINKTNFTESESLSFVECILRELSKLPRKEDLQEFLLRRGFAGKTALHLACSGTDDEACALARTLLTFSPDSRTLLTASDNRGMTPMHSVCSKGYFNTALLFVERWAEEEVLWSSASVKELQSILLAKTKKLNTPFHCLVMAGPDGKDVQRERIAEKMFRLLGHPADGDHDVFPYRIMEVLCMKNRVGKTILDFGPLSYVEKESLGFSLIWQRYATSTDPSGAFVNTSFCETPVYTMKMKSLLRSLLKGETALAQYFGAQGKRRKRIDI